MSCSTFEHFSTFLQWFVQEVHGLTNLDYYLDDFFFAEMSHSVCSNSMFKFKNICKRLGVPIADEKREGPVTSMEYLGLTIDTESMSVKIPEDQIKECLKHLKEVEFSKNVTLKQLQSLCGSFAFCTRALPADRAFSRRLYFATAKAKNPHHLIRVTKEMYEDLLMWKYFVGQSNGNSFILDEWISNCVLEPYTDSAGGGSKGCGAYCKSK